MKADTRIRQYFSARYPLVWITTTEEERTIRKHRTELKEATTIFRWDISQGWTQFVKNGSGWTWKPMNPDEPQQSPGQALTEIPLNFPENSIFYLLDYHKFFEDITVVRRALNIKDILKSRAQMVCFISCKGSGSIPDELKNDVTVFQPPLPSQDDLKETIKRIASDNNIKEPEPQELEILSNALIGLTEENAENALALSLVVSKKFDSKILMREKVKLIQSNAGLTYIEFSETLDDIVGNEIAIAYLLKAAPSKLSSCVLLHGIAGTGKSHISKALGNVLKWPVLQASFATVRSKYIGDTEGNLERMLNTIDALGRSIVFVDEIDKAIKGSEGEGDSGVGARIIGRLLQYFADKPENGSYWIMTCNSISDILTISGGALVRRFDAMFFLDLPSSQERKGIIKVWNRKNGTNIPEDFPTDGFSGADIAKLTKTVKMLGCSPEEARTYVIPTAKALGNRIDEIRKAASSTCIPASKPQEPGQTTRARKVDTTEWDMNPKPRKE